MNCNLIKSFCDKTDKFNKLFASTVLSFFFITNCFGQLSELEVNTNIQTGIIQNIDAQNELGVFQFKVDQLDFEGAMLVYKELNKYSGEIIGYGYSVLDELIIVSFENPIYPNFVLAILDRVNIRGYYSENGIDIYFVKDGTSAFIR